LNRKVAVLEWDAARMAAYEEPNYQWNFQIALSCPPSTVIHVRGGQVWGNPDSESGWQWYVPSGSYDLADEDDTGFSYTFAVAYTYRAVSVHIRYSGNPDYIYDPPDPFLRFVPATGEFSTAAGAENDAYFPWEGGIYVPDIDYGICLGIFVLRNNGNTAEPNQFMPIDRANRGRSYYWRNIKHRFHW
jgi:hypothetical protein